MKKIIASMTCLLLLGGCGGGAFLKSSEPQQTIYSLRPAQVKSANGEGVTAKVIEIAKPGVPPGFETDRIALYMNDGRTLDYYSGAKWADILDNVVQDFTRRTATAVLPYVVTTTPNQLLDANYRLQLKLNEFQAVYGSTTSAAPMLSVDVEFTLISLPDERIVRSFNLSRRGTASSNNLETIAAGLEKMLQEVEEEAFLRFDSRLKTP